MTFIKMPLHNFDLEVSLTVCASDELIWDQRVVYLCRFIFFCMSNDLTAKEKSTEKFYLFKSDTSGMILL